MCLKNFFFKKQAESKLRKFSRMVKYWFYLISLKDNWLFKAIIVTTYCEAYNICNNMLYENNGAKGKLGNRKYTF